MTTFNVDEFCARPDVKAIVDEFLSRVEPISVAKPKPYFFIFRKSKSRDLDVNKIMTRIDPIAKSLQVEAWGLEPPFDYNRLFFKSEVYLKLADEFWKVQAFYLNRNENIHLAAITNSQARQNEKRALNFTEAEYDLHFSKRVFEKHSEKAKEK